MHPTIHVSPVGKGLQRLPSIPSSPVEEDLGDTATSTWEGTADEEAHGNLVKKWKGKGRDDGSPELGAGEDEIITGSEGYPPIQDEEVESRKIEENLRRWELAERQRRKAARESASASSPPSVIGSVGRRASLLWPGRKARGGSVRTQRSQRPRESDYGVPLGSIEGSPPSSMPESPTSSGPSPRHSLENPFEPPTPTVASVAAEFASSAPASSSISPFDDRHRSEIMNSVPLKPTAGLESETTSAPPFLHDIPASLLKPPPPAPLGLPPPKTPPPRVMTPIVTKSLQQEEGESRWWTDWLCGCRESDDREQQAGRTNPFE